MITDVFLPTFLLKLTVIYLLSFSNEPLEEEGEEVRECVELAVEADVLVAELYSILDVWVFVFFQKVEQRVGYPDSNKY